MSELLNFDNTGELIKSLARTICEQLTAAIESRGQARLVVSGGTTPLPLFNTLAHRDLPWARVGVTLADERLVNAGHPRSNERLVREHLLQHRAGAAKFIPLQQVAAEWTASPRFDLVLLGMGNDGHTASLFPDAPELEQALRPGGEIVQAMTPPSQPEKRLTLTVDALCDSRRLILHIEGLTKLEVLKKAQQAGPINLLPVRAVIEQERVPLSIYWAP